ncbi:MAG TPA: zinc-binding alcohol dehydrogenase [Steroidobacter sp.]|uniref:zinc-dependent alcohol dehydrogenase n=1 Tax=Steroidobacter sp. TaxID=1978227 RepID=UPI002ED9E014
MPTWLINLLGSVYSKLPVAIRPPLKRVFLWGLIRIQGLTSGRRVQQGKHVEFLDFEIAHLEPYEFLSPAPNEVQVRVARTTVSPGTERAVLCGLPGARRPFPYVPGYSAAGEVVAVGKNVKGISVGDQVAGRVHHSSNETVPAALLFRVPPGVGPESASFIELGIITLQGIRKARISAGDRVAVVGQGLIGQLANRLARAVGASTVIAVAPSRRRAKTALSGAGADEFISLEKGNQVLDEIQADVVIEAVGTPDAVTTAMQCARDGGKVVLLGSSRGLSRDVDVWSTTQQRNLTIIGAHISAIPERDASLTRWSYRQEGKLFLDLLHAGRLQVADLITWHAAPNECNAVFEVLAKGGADQVAISFNWQAAH